MAMRPFHGVDRSFDRMFDGWPEFSFGWTDGGELIERESEYVYVLDLPGFDADEIDLRFEGDTLSVAAEHEADEETVAQRRSVREHVHVPGAVERDAVRATYNNGVLEVTLPTAESGEDGTRIDVE